MPPEAERAAPARAALARVGVVVAVGADGRGRDDEGGEEHAQERGDEEAREDLCQIQIFN